MFLEAHTVQDVQILLIAMEYPCILFQPTKLPTFRGLISCVCTGQILGHARNLLSVRDTSRLVVLWIDMVISGDSCTEEAFLLYLQG